MDLMRRSGETPGFAMEFVRSRLFAVPPPRGARLLVAGVAAVLMAAAMGCASIERPHVVDLPARLSAAGEMNVRLDTLEVGDSLWVRFPYRPDLTQRVQIGADGRVGLPLVGAMDAASLTSAELESRLRRRFAEIAYDPLHQPSDKQYLINTGDKLEIRFRDAQKLNADVVVRPDGKISLDLVKSVIAEGKTPEQLEKDLIRAYSTFLTNPDLVVIVKEFTSERFYVAGRLMRQGAKDVDDVMVTVASYAPRLVYVAGEVRSPGFVRYQPPLTALEAIIAAGGTLRSASIGRVVVLRRERGATPTATFLDLSGDLHGSSNNDLPLRPFDIVIVSKSHIAQLNDFLDQYLYQLIPAARNISFTYFYDLRRP